MMKTIKIAGFSKALIVFALLILVSSSYADVKLEGLLKTPGIAEQLQASNGGKRTSDTEQDTPLVRQAREFALRINPPPPPQPVAPVVSPGDRRPVRPQVEVSAKFKLLGTSYHFDDNAQSWALVDEVGKGLHWVKQGSKVGHLEVEKVGDGGILINDNGRRYELLAERQDKPDFVKSYTGTIFENEPIVLLNEEEKASLQVEQIPAGYETQPAENSGLTQEEHLKQTQANIEWLKSLQNDPNAVGMSDGEASELSGLGEMLKALEAEAQNMQEVTAETNVPQPQSQPPVEPVNQEEVSNETPGEVPPQPQQGRDSRLRRIRERR